MGFSYLQADAFNLLNKRNETNVAVARYNCGGYAFRTFNWYVPYNYHGPSMERQGTKLLKEGRTPDEAIQILTHTYTDYMLKDFRGRLKRINRIEDVGPMETVILFRIGLYFDKTECYDGDFHFRVRRNGHWTEKAGGEEIAPTVPALNDIWCDQETGFEYTGPIVIFTLH